MCDCNIKFEALVKAIKEDNYEQFSNFFKYLQILNSKEYTDNIRQLEEYFGEESFNKERIEKQVSASEIVDFEKLKMNIKNFLLDDRPVTPPPSRPSSPVSFTPEPSVNSYGKSKKKN